MASWLQDMYLWLDLVPKQPDCFVREQGLDSHDRLRLMDKNVDDICNVVRKPGSKNANIMPNRDNRFQL